MPHLRFQMVLPIPLLLLLIVSVAPASPSVQLLQVRENVNVTMTCHFDSSQSSMMANELSSSSPLASFELYLGSQPTENIILWYKDNTKVIGVNSISNDAKKYSITQLNLHTYQLTIINVQLESSGLYKCQNFTAKEENRFQLNVIGMSLIRRSIYPCARDFFDRWDKSRVNFNQRDVREVNAAAVFLASLSTDEINSMATRFTSLTKHEGPSRVSRLM